MARRQQGGGLLVSPHDGHPESLCPFQTVSSIHPANGAHMDETSERCSADFGCVRPSAEHILAPSTRSEQKLLEWRGL